eukprot:s593_g17.t1
MPRVAEDDEIFHVFRSTPAFLWTAVLQMSEVSEAGSCRWLFTKEALEHAQEAAHERASQAFGISERDIRSTSKSPLQQSSGRRCAMDVRGQTGPLLGTVCTAREDQGFGFIGVEGKRDVYFKLDDVRRSAGLQIRKGDVLKYFTRSGRDGKDYVCHVELSDLAPRSRRRSDALHLMETWREQLQDASAVSATLLEAGACLAVWRSVSELLSRALHSQWDALAPNDEDMDVDKAEAKVDTADASNHGPKRHDVFKTIAEEVVHENEKWRKHLPFQQQQMKVSEVFFTHGEVSAQFRNGDTLTQLVSDLRRSRVLPSKDDRLRLEVFELKQRVRSVNNRRLWVLKEFQREVKDSDVEVAVNLHPLCKGTAKFLADFCASLTEVTEVVNHPEMFLASQTLQDILAEAGSRPWVLQDHAEMRSRVALDDLKFAGQQRVPARKRRREWRENQEEIEGAQCKSSCISDSDRGLAQKLCRGEGRLDVVDFRGDLYTADRRLGETLHQLQQERKERFCVNVRVIPLCPSTAKVVLANSSQNNGDSVNIRGSLQYGWPLDRIVSLVLELALALATSPRAREVYATLAKSRMLGERSALIKAIRSKQRWSQQVLKNSWPFLQQLMKLAPSKFNAALPICTYLSNADGQTPEAAVQLLSLLSTASKRLSGSEDAADEVPWNCMSTVPSEVELKSLQILPNNRRSRSALQRLPVVRQCGSYKSAGEYFDTYFRLLREDCLSAICHSFAYVKQRRHQSDAEMEATGNVFKATLKGFTVGKGDSDSRIKVVFEIRPMYSWTRWQSRAMRFFMNGNLLACVCDEDFTDPIWLLAARRDLNRSEVALEFYLSDISKDEALLVARLCNSRQMILIASPTYFRSFEPVLQSLKTWEAVGLPFHKELVECEPVEDCGMLSDRIVDRDLIFFKSVRTDPIVPNLEEDKDDDNVMLVDLPQHLAATSDAAAPPMQLIGVSTAALGLSWVLQCGKAKTEVKFQGEALFDIIWQSSRSGLFCCNRCAHQIQVVAREPATATEPTEPAQPAQRCIHFVLPGCLTSVKATDEIVTSTGSRELRFRIAEISGTMRQLREEIARAIKNPRGPLARATTWDSSQLEAAEHALKCRVALIQGPPGTGKTFIGCKLLQMFLPQSRVLVLTYKNHALDDFLQHCIDAGYVEDVARIGGRSTADSQELQSANLRSMKKKIEGLATASVGRKKQKTDVEPVFQELMKQASQAKWSLSKHQHLLLEALMNFRARGIHTLETFLTASTGKQVLAFLQRWMERWLQRIPEPKSWDRQQKDKFEECRDIVRLKLEGNWDQLPELLCAAENPADPDAWALRRFRDFLDWALKDWYPKAELVAEAARAYLARDGEVDEEKDGEPRIVTREEAPLVVESVEELHRIRSHLGQNMQVLRDFQLRPGGVSIEQGWRLCRCTDKSGDVGWNDIPELPVTLYFEADDEAERELQAEIEAERLQGAGLDTRESLSEAERKAMVSATPPIEDTKGRPQVPRLPYDVAAENLERWQHLDLFRLNQQERAQLIVLQLVAQAQRSFQQLQRAGNDLATACEEEKAYEMNFNTKVLETKIRGPSRDPQKCRDVC